MGTTQAATTYDIERIELLPDAIRRVPRALAQRHDVLPLFAHYDVLTVAMPDPGDRDVIDRLRFATGLRVEAIGAQRDVIRERLQEAYPRTQGSRSDDAPAVRALDEIQAAAIAAGSSDIHLEPVEGGGRVRHRVLGLLVPARQIPGDLFAQVVSRIKLLANMDIADRRSPQDGRYEIASGTHAVEARVSSMPTIGGEKIVVRLLDHHARIPSLVQLGMPDAFLSRFAHAITRPHGFVVVCGPTGSGKTTTLYSALTCRDLQRENVCTVEDPVEVRVAGATQVQVNAKAGVTFASALRGFLRQDPDVIMVGEMRDEETASVAAGAALSGQLVLTTLHASDACTAIERLAELGVSNHALAAGLSAVVSQRLVRHLCVRCRAPYAAGAHEAQEFGLQQGVTIWRAGGCGKCNGSGYDGRVAVFEAIFADDMLRALVAQRAGARHVAMHAKASGYRPMLADGLRRVLTGDTTLDELRRVVPVSGE